MRRINSKNIALIGLIHFMTIRLELVSQTASSSYYQNTSLNHLSIPILGINSSAFGYRALFFNTSVASDNTATGCFAMHKNTQGSFNTANGYYSLYSNANTSNGLGNKNTAIGALSLRFNTNGNDNTAIGYASLSSNIDGLENTSTGVFVLLSNIHGCRNTASGPYSMYYNNYLGGNDGHDNTATGDSTLLNNIGGNKNTATGAKALYSNTYGSENVAFGYQALFNNFIDASANFGDGNVAVGSDALFSNLAGDLNVASGNQALFNNISGYYNVGCGLKSLYQNSSGNHNIGVGIYSNYQNANGLSNVSIGNYASYNSTLDGNTAIGTSALYSNYNGEFNTALGALSALQSTPGKFNTMLGAYSNVSGTYTNATAIGYGAVAISDDEIYLGNTSVNKIESTMGIIQSSDKRFKYNINENDIIGLDFINRLKPVVYNFDTKKYTEFITSNMPDSLKSIYLENDFEESTSIRQSGFIAQEVMEACIESRYDFNGVIKPRNKSETYRLNYSLFVVPLVKAVQEQQLMIEKLKELNLKFQEKVNNLGRSLIISKNQLVLDKKDCFRVITRFDGSTKTTKMELTLLNTVSEGLILITNLKGKKLEMFKLTDKLSIYELSSDNINKSICVFTLVSQGKVIAQKKVVIN